MSLKQPKENGKVNNEFLLYRIDELREFMAEVLTEFRGYRKDTDTRVSALELASAAQRIINEANTPAKIDWQKVVLGFIALISTIVVTAFGILGKVSL